MLQNAASALSRMLWTLTSQRLYCGPWTGLSLVPEVEEGSRDGGDGGISFELCKGTDHSMECEEKMQRLRYALKIRM